MLHISFLDALKMTFKVIEYKFQQNFLTTNETVQIQTDKGLIKGLKRKTVYGEYYYSFEKIPFAKPPLGEHRFKAPIPLDPWTDVKDCTQSCEVPLQADLLFKKHRGSEDCLYLNVFSRNLNPEKPVPVMVWIYGGGFQVGEATRDFYGPDYFMAKDVVVVSITYRVGPFGFLSLKDPKLNIPGNAGLKDQILGLRWVNKNISRFGGDPNNITLFGESAGGASTHLLMTSQQTKGLFHKAIMQSGSALCHWVMPPMNNWSYRLAVLLSYTGTNEDQGVYEFLAKASGPDIIKAAGKILSKDEERYRILFAFAPVVEPYITDDCVLPKEPLELMRTTWSNDIPLMIGGNSDEGLLMVSEIKNRPITLDEVKDCEYLVPLDLNLSRESDKCKEYGLRIKQAHFGEKECGQNTSMQYFDLMSYKLFWHAIHRTVLSRLEYNAAPTFLYRFEFDSSLPNVFHNLICGTEYRGACHGDEVLYLFNSMFAQKLPKNSLEYKTRQRMIDIWTTFAMTSNPNCGAISDICVKPLDKSDRVFKCLNISNDVSVIDLPEANKLALWDSIYDKQQLY